MEQQQAVRDAVYSHNYPVLQNEQSANFLTKPYWNDIEWVYTRGREVAISGGTPVNLTTYRNIKDNESLIDRIQKGDRDAFLVFVRKYQQEIFHHCYTILYHGEDAEDITEEIFLGILEDPHKIQNPKSIRYYLHKTAWGMCMKKHKENRKTADLTPPDDEHEAEDPIQNLPDTSALPADTAAIRAERNAIIEDAMRNLKPILREIIHLVHFEGFTIKEAAEILDIPENTAKTNLYKALRRLGDMLAPRKEELLS